MRVIAGGMMGNKGSTTPAQPGFCQLQQQVVLGDIKEICPLPETLWYDTDYDWDLLFDKEMSPCIPYGPAFNGGTYALEVELTHPKLLSRVVLSGHFNNGENVVVILITPAGSVTVIDTTISRTETMLDSGNFEPEVVQFIEVIITVPPSGPIAGTIQHTDVLNPPFQAGEPLLYSGGGTAVFGSDAGNVMVVTDSTAMMITGQTITGTLSGASCEATGDLVPAAPLPTGSICELTLFKTIETKTWVENMPEWTSPVNPIQVQAEQQICSPEIDWSSSLSNSNIAPSTLSNLQAGMDKSLLTGTTFGLGGGVATYVFTHPILIANVAAFGLFNPGATLQMLTCAGITEPLVTVPSGEGAEPMTCMESGNFQPVYVAAIIITVPAEQQATQTLLECVALKVIEVKAATNLNPLVSTPLFLGVEVVLGQPLVQNPIDPSTQLLFTGMPDLAGMGVEVGKDDHEYNLEIAIRTIGDIPPTAYNGKVDWYFSVDDISYFYFASQELDDTVGPVGSNPNPTGWNDEDTDTSWRNLAVPEHAYGKYVAVIVRNEAQDAFTIVLAQLVRQR